MEGGRYFSPQHMRTNAAIPFKDHPQFPKLVDILIRKYTHHAIVTADFSTKLYPSFLEALLQHLTSENIPVYLRGSELFLFDSQKVDFHELNQKLDQSEKILLLVMTNTNLFLNDSKRQIEILMTHPKCRFIILTHAHDISLSPPFCEHFTMLSMNGPTNADIMTILKQQRAELESHHHVLMPDELLTLAYTLAERYLSTTNTVDQALLLLDSSSARAAAMERSDVNHHLKPVLTTTVMLNVLSGWTQIPASQLQFSKFKLNDFLTGMQLKIFGQDTAINTIGYELQQAQARLDKKLGPLCSFLFVGPYHAGKKSTAVALVEQLFKQLSVLYVAQAPSSPLTHIAELKMQRYTDKASFPLKEVLKQTPYAVILFDNIDASSPELLDGIQQILTTGRIVDAAHQSYAASQVILILTSAIATKRLTDIAKSMSAPEEDIGHYDLMQLVLNEQSHQSDDDTPTMPKEWVEKIMPDIHANLPAAICQHLRIVPFLPLSKSAIDKIVRQKLKLLAKQLDQAQGIELSYANEVVRYLVEDALALQRLEKQVVDVDKALKQLYFSIEQAVLSQIDNKHRPHHLYLKLNESGQVLFCDWTSTTDSRQHAT